MSEDQADTETSNTLGDLVDEELASTAHAVEAASLRIQEMLRKSREDDTGVKLEVNERVLDSCTGLMKAIKILIARSKDLQAEILGEGMVSGGRGRYRGTAGNGGGDWKWRQEGGNMLYALISLYLCHYCCRELTVMQTSSIRRTRDGLKGLFLPPSK